MTTKTKWVLIVLAVIAAFLATRFLTTRPPYGGGNMTLRPPLVHGVRPDQFVEHPAVRSLG